MEQQSGSRSCRRNDNFTTFFNFYKLLLNMKLEPYQLTLPNRLLILSNIPKEGNIITLRIVRELINELALTAEEISEFEVIQLENAVQYNEKAKIPKSFPLDDVKVDVIKKAFKELNDKNKLTLDLVEVYDKFLP